MATRIVAKNVRLSYVHVLEPRLTPDGTEEKYSVSIILDPKENAADIKAIKAAIETEVVGKFGAKAKAQLGKKYHTPLRDGDDRDDPAYEGKLFINASGKRRPQVVDRKTMPVVDPDEIYSGCYANVSFSLFPFDVKTNAGVGCGLNNIQVLRKGERLDGSVAASDEFEEVEGDEDMD